MAIQDMLRELQKLYIETQENVSLRILDIAWHFSVEFSELDSKWTANGDGKLLTEKESRPPDVPPALPGAGLVMCFQMVTFDYTQTQCLLGLYQRT